MRSLKPRAQLYTKESSAVYLNFIITYYVCTYATTDFLWYTCVQNQIKFMQLKMPKDQKIDLISGNDR